MVTKKALCQLNHPLRTVFVSNCHRTLFLKVESNSAIHFDSFSVISQILLSQTIYFFEPFFILKMNICSRKIIADNTKSFLPVHNCQSLETAIVQYVILCSSASCSQLQSWSYQHKTELLPQRNERLLLLDPNMSKCGPVAWIQASLNKLSQHGNAFMNTFTVAEQKNNLKSKYFLNTLLRTLGRWIMGKSLCRSQMCSVVIPSLWVDSNWWVGR